MLAQALVFVCSTHAQRIIHSVNKKVIYDVLVVLRQLSLFLVCHVSV